MTVEVSHGRHWEAIHHLQSRSDKPPSHRSFQAISPGTFRADHRAAIDTTGKWTGSVSNDPTDINTPATLSSKSLPRGLALRNRSSFGNDTMLPTINSRNQLLAERHSASTSPRPVLSTSSTVFDSATCRVRAFKTSRNSPSNVLDLVVQLAIDFGHQLRGTCIALCLVNACSEQLGH